MANLTGNEYAQHRGVHPQAVAKALKTGRITRNSKGKIDPVQADADWLKNTEPQIINMAAGRPSKKIARDVESYGKSRALREQYNAALAKLEFEKQSGELIRADQVRNEAFMAARTTRNMLQAIPARVSAILAGETDEKKIYRMLEEAIDDACRSLADKVESEN